MAKEKEGNCIVVLWKKGSTMNPAITKHQQIQHKPQIHEKKMRLH